MDFVDKAKSWLQSRSKGEMAVIIAIVVVLILALMLWGSTQSSEPQQEVENLTPHVELQDAESRPLPDKSDAYKRSYSNTDDYFNSLDEDEDFYEEIDSTSLVNNDKNDPITSALSSLTESAQTKDSSNKKKTYAEIYGDDSPLASLEKTLSDPQKDKKDEPEAITFKDIERLNAQTIEQSKDLYRSMLEAQADVYGKNGMYGYGNTQSPASNSENSSSVVPSEESEPAVKESPVKEAKLVRKSGIVGSLDDDVTDGISVLGDDSEFISEEHQDAPIECMFVKQEKLTSGSRVSVRLLEDMMVDGLVIPKNTHLMAQCQIGERISLTISSFEMKGRIYKLNYSAYDVDGGEGIYCPDLSRVKEQVKREGGNFFRRMFMGRVVSDVSEVANTAIDIARSSKGTVTAIIPEGYKFFILRSRF